MLKKKKANNDNGIMASDAIIAILIILLFSGFIISLITSITREKIKIKQNSFTTEVVTKIFEYVESLPYSEVTEEKLIEYVNSQNKKSVSAGTSLDSLSTTCKVQINVTRYNQTEGNQDKLDFIKIVTVIVDNTIENKHYSMEASKVKKAKDEEIEEMLTQ